MLERGLRVPPHRLILIIQRIGEQRPQLRGEIGRAAFGLGAGGAEVHEPILEQRPRQGFQRLVGLAVEFDFVVEGPE